MPALSVAVSDQVRESNMAVIIKQVAEASKESQHSADLEHILLHGDRVYTCADDGMVKVRVQGESKRVGEMLKYDLLQQLVLS